MRIFGLIFSFILLLPLSAKADVFVWEDPESGLTLSFPDTWSVLNNQAPDDILTVKAPSATDEAVCRVRIRPDARYVIFPPRYSSAVQKVAYSTEFWQDYLRSQYTDIMLHRVRDQAGLSHGYASYMFASFTTLGEVADLKSAIGYATLYNDHAYILECSSLAGVFENWIGMFQSIGKSIDFKKAHHELATGNYDDFINE